MKPSEISPGTSTGSSPAGDQLTTGMEEAFLERSPPNRSSIVCARALAEIGAAVPLLWAAS